MINTTIIGEKLLESTQEEGMRILSEIYTPSFLLVFLTILIITILMGVVFIRKDFGNFLAVFIFPFFVTLILTLLFVVVFPKIPMWTGGWFEDVLIKIGGG